MFGYTERLLLRLILSAKRHPLASSLFSYRNLHQRLSKSREKLQLDSMLPSLNIPSGTSPWDVQRVAPPTHSQSSRNSSSRQSLSMNASVKFDEAMEMYCNSMAIRKRRMSLHNMASERRGSSDHGSEAESDSMHSSNSPPTLKGPQLRPMAHMQRVAPSHSITGSPTTTPPLRQTPLAALPAISPAEAEPGTLDMQPLRRSIRSIAILESPKEFISVGTSVSRSGIRSDTSPSSAHHLSFCSSQSATVLQQSKEQAASVGPAPLKTMVSVPQQKNHHSEESDALNNSLMVSYNSAMISSRGQISMAAAPSRCTTDIRVSEPGGTPESTLPSTTTQLNDSTYGVSGKEQQQQQVPALALQPNNTTPGAGIVSPHSTNTEGDGEDQTTAKFYSTASMVKNFDGAQYLNDYILLGEIGSGATGKVMLAFSVAMNRSVAIKIIAKPKEKKYRLMRSRVDSDSLDSTDKASQSGGRGDDESKVKGRKAATPLTTAERKTRSLQREIEVMKDLNHKNIVRLFEVINDPKANSLFLIIQYVDSGSIAQIKPDGTISNKRKPGELIPVALQACNGLVYLHDNHIVHRDIKPENILENRNGDVFLADFGVAELMSAEAGLPTVDTLAYQGTPLFMAPEIYAMEEDHLSNSGEQEEGGEAAGSRSPTGDGNDTPRLIDPFALDVWALGVTFYTLLVGAVPFSSMQQIRETLRNGVHLPDCITSEWLAVLRRCLEPNAKRRATAMEVQHLISAMHTQWLREEAERRKQDGGKDDGATQKAPQNGSRTSRKPSKKDGGLSFNRGEEEDVIMGSCTPEESVAFGSMEKIDMDHDFINSSALDVLRPVPLVRKSFQS